MKNVTIKNHSAMMYVRSQRGASLLEGIAYLGIAALVVLGAVSLLTGAFTSAQSNRGAEEVVSIRTGVKKLYAGQANAYAPALLTQPLITAGIFPTTLSPAGNNLSLTNSWGGLVTVAGAGNTFTITYTEVPTAACISMLSGASGWFEVNQGAVAATRLFPVSPAQAAVQCVGANGLNVINFTSR